MSENTMTADAEHEAAVAQAVAKAMKGEVPVIASSVPPLRTTDINLIAPERRIYYGKLQDGSGYKLRAVDVRDAASTAKYVAEISRGEIELLEPGDVPGVIRADRQRAEVDEVFKRELAAGEARQAAEAAQRQAALDAQAIRNAARLRSFFRR